MATDLDQMVEDFRTGPFPAALQSAVVVEVVGEVLVGPFKSRGYRGRIVKGAQ